MTAPPAFFYKSKPVAEHWLAPPISSLAVNLMSQLRRAVDIDLCRDGRELPCPHQIIAELASRYDPGVPAVAQALTDWMKAKADGVFNDAPSFGSVGPQVLVQGQPCLPLRFWTDGSAAINFIKLKMTSAFAAPAARQELADKLNAIPGVTLNADESRSSAFLALPC